MFLFLFHSAEILFNSIEEIWYFYAIQSCATTYNYSLVFLYYEFDKEKKYCIFCGCKFESCNLFTQHFIRTHSRHMELIASSEMIIKVLISITFITNQKKYFEINKDFLENNWYELSKIKELLSLPTILPKSLHNYTIPIRTLNNVNFKPIAQIQHQRYIDSNTVNSCIIDSCSLDNFDISELLPQVFSLVYNCKH